jgi:hypothetical protein
MHLLPDFDCSVEIFLFVLKIHKYFIGIWVHFKIELIEKWQNKALDLIFFKRIGIDQHHIVDNMSIKHIFTYYFLKQFPCICKHQLSI